MDRYTITRAWAIALAVLTLATALATNITPDLWFISGKPVDVFTAAYIAALYYVAARPRNHLGHQAAMPLGLLFWGGRAANGAAIAVDNDQRAAWTITTTGLAIAVLQSALHLHTIRAIAVDETIDR